MSIKKSTKKKVNRGNSCEHGIPKSKKCSKCIHAKNSNRLVIEKVTKKLPTSEKRKALMEAVKQVIVERSVSDNYTITLTPGFVKKEEKIDVPLFTHQKLFRIELADDLPEKPYDAHWYFTGLVQGVALGAVTWMIHKLNINWHDIF